MVIRRIKNKFEHIFQDLIGLSLIYEFLKIETMEIFSFVFSSLPAVVPNNWRVPKRTFQTDDKISKTNIEIMSIKVILAREEDAISHPEDLSYEIRTPSKKYKFKFWITVKWFQIQSYHMRNWNCIKILVWSSDLCSPWTIECLWLHFSSYQFSSRTVVFNSLARHSFLNPAYIL